MPMSNKRFKYEYDPNIELIVYSVVFVISLFSFVFNGFVLYLVSRMKLRWDTFSHQLITAIAVVDMLCTLGVFTGHIDRLVLGFPGMFDSPWHCRIVGLSMVLLTCYSGILVSMLAFERYFLICLHRNIRPKQGWSVLIVVSLLLAVPAFGNTVLDGYSPDPTYSYCWPNGTKWAFIENNVITALFIAPLIILTFCYISIFITCYRWQEEPLCQNRLNIERKVEQARMSRKVAYRALFFIFFYFLCFGPKVTSTMWHMVGKSGTHPFILYMLDPFGIQLVMAVNPVLVLFLHRQFKSEVQKILSNRINRDLDAEFKVLT